MSHDRHIAAALERMAPPVEARPDFTIATAFSWSLRGLMPVPRVAHLPIDLLQGIDQAQDILLRNTKAFVEGFPANHALLWGARGSGKSSLVKSLHAVFAQQGLVLIEVASEDLPDIVLLLRLLREYPSHRFVLFCDDLSFEEGDASYKALKTALDGGIEGCPPHVVIYATSNRRHLMPREMVENQSQKSIYPSEIVDEKLSLSDRFGLWLGFYPCHQETFLNIIRGYCTHYGVKIDDADLRARAIEWRQTRGAMSGRVAWQFFCDLAAQHQVDIWAALDW